MDNGQRKHLPFVEGCASVEDGQREKIPWIRAGESKR